MTKDTSTQHVVKAPFYGGWKSAAKTNLIIAFDWTMRMVGAAFILATSFLYVRMWLLENQTNRDISLGGAIIVLSVATYLIIRRR